MKVFSLEDMENEISYVMDGSLEYHMLFFNHKFNFLVLFIRQYCPTVKRLNPQPNVGKDRNVTTFVVFNYALYPWLLV